MKLPLLGLCFAYSLAALFGPATGQIAGPTAFAVYAICAMGLVLIGILPEYFNAALNIKVIQGTGVVSTVAVVVLPVILAGIFVLYYGQGAGLPIIRRVAGALGVPFYGLMLYGGWRGILDPSHSAAFMKKTAGAKVDFE